MKKGRVLSILLSLTLMLGLITGMTAYAETGHTHDSTTFENAWSTNNSLPDKSGSYYLTTNVTISSTWIVPNGTTNLCLNGHKITYSSNDNHPTEEVIWISGNSTLNLYDCKASGIITGGYGGVCNSGTFNMHGGTISGNESTDGAGVLNHVSFTMSGGKISGNKATGNKGGKGGGVKNNGIFTMSGGEISGNTTNDEGSGVYNGDDAKFIMSGGKISGNANEQPYGSGVNNYGTFQLSGSPIITGNTAGGAVHNVCLGYGTKITITGPLTSGASVGVTLDYKNGTFTSGYKTNNGSTAPSTYFSSDDNSYAVTLDSNGEAQLDAKSTVTTPTTTTAPETTALTTTPTTTAPTTTTPETTTPTTTAPKTTVEQPTSQEKITIMKSPAGVKAKAKKAKVTVTWNKIKKNKAGKKLLKQIRYIQVQASTDPAFTNIAATKNVGKKKTKATMKLARKTTYYVRVRYVGADGVSAWSKVKRVKTK